MRYGCHPFGVWRVFEDAIRWYRFAQLPATKLGCLRHHPPAPTCQQGAASPTCQQARHRPPASMARRHPPAKQGGITRLPAWRHRPPASMAASPACQHGAASPACQHGAASPACQRGVASPPASVAWHHHLPAWRGIIHLAANRGIIHGESITGQGSPHGPRHLTPVSVGGSALATA